MEKIYNFKNLKNITFKINEDKNFNDSEFIVSLKPLYNYMFLYELDELPIFNDCNDILYKINNKFYDKYNNKFYDKYNNLKLNEINEQEILDQYVKDNLEEFKLLDEKFDELVKSLIIEIARQLKLNAFR